MNTLLYYVVRTLMALLQSLPLMWVARLGRMGGAIFCAIDARHRRVALKNMSACFPEQSQAEVKALVRENFRRIGENFASAVKTASMDVEQLKPHVVFVGADKFMKPHGHSGSKSCVFAVGHFGNFEMYPRFGQFVSGYQCATTYRGLRQPALNRLMQSLRERSGCLFFERRTDAAALKAAMAEKELLLGLLADQHAGDTGLKLPFFGRDCSTSAAPAVFALRYHCPLFPAICYRVGLAQWRIEVGDEIATRENGHPRSVEAIMGDVNREFEAAVRRDPANWFWVHNRWKPGKWRERRSQFGGTVTAPPEESA
ncbi:MAG TPA: hypothetical protein VK968_11705 [Roseimicrobium sp.]|nr:hypothetical protein [Roseimicrobium sp.]